MGYVREPTVYRLRFEDPAMNGLIVRVAGLTTGELLELVRLGSDPGEVEKLFRLFAAKLVDWNLEQPEGVSVPATYEGVLSQEDGFVLQLIDAWQEAVAGVPAPLARTSGGGRPSPVASIPMVPLSENRAS